MGALRVMDIRCPVGPKRLLARMRQEGHQPGFDPDANVVEFACSDCARGLRKAGRDVERVLHRYNFIGDLVESVIVDR